MQTIGRWRPAKETHSIYLASATVTLGQPIGDVLWRKVDADLAVRVGKLGLTERLQVYPDLPIPVQAILGGQGLPDIGAGYVKRERSDFFSEQVRITRDQVRYEHWEYTRWAPFLERARSMMVDPINRYCEVSDLSSIALQYVDVFVSEEGEEDLDVSQVINFNSPAVAVGAVRQSTPWHTHSGWFEYPDPVTRRLFNINIDVLDHQREAGNGLAIQITTTATDQFGQQGIAKLGDGEGSWELVENRLDALHLALKNILRGALTDKATDAISLK